MRPSRFDLLRPFQTETSETNEGGGSSPRCENLVWSCLCYWRGVDILTSFYRYTRSRSRFSNNGIPRFCLLRDRFDFISFLSLIDAERSRKNGDRIVPATRRLAEKFDVSFLLGVYGSRFGVCVLLLRAGFPQRTGASSGLSPVRYWHWRRPLPYEPLTNPTKE